MTTTVAVFVAATLAALMLRGLLALSTLHFGAVSTASAASGIAGELVVSALLTLPVLLEARPAFPALAMAAAAAAASCRTLGPRLGGTAAAAACVARELVILARGDRTYPIALLEARVPAVPAAVTIAA